MKVIENKNSRIITVTQQGLVLVEDSGVIIQIDQEVIIDVAEEFGMTIKSPVCDPEEITKLQIQLESALATCKQADETIKEKDATIEELRFQCTEFESAIELLRQQKASLKEQYDNNLRTFDREKAQLWEVISAKDRTITEKNRTITEKDKTIEALRKDIARGNQLINQLESQRNSAKDSVTQLEKQLEEQISTITEKNKLLGKLSKRVEEYGNNNKYIERYCLVNNDTVILDCSFEHEPIVCIDSETAGKALEKLLNGAKYDEIYEACETSPYWLRFYDDHAELIAAGTNNLVILNNKPIATNLYKLLKCGYITMDDIKELTKTNNK